MKQAIISWYIPLIILCVLAYFVQSHIFLHKDVGVITHAAAAMLAGETYGKNIFEPSPPMILYLSMPAIAFAKLISITTLSALRIYFILLAFISLNCSFYLIKRLFKESTFLTYLLAYTMVYVLLFLPAQHFAQREHFLLVLILPYLLAAGLRLDHKNINPYFATLIGIMAGVGFSIKPHFLPALILVESYFIVEKRSFFGWFRIETACILAILVTYLATIMLFYSGYLHTVLPLWMPYYTAIIHSWPSVILYPGFVYCLCIVMLYCLIKRFTLHYKISTVFLLAMLGFMLAYLIPRVSWYYHIIPALGIACLLATCIFWQLRLKTEGTANTKSESLIFACLWLIIVFVPLTLSLSLLTKSLQDFQAKDNFKQQLIHFITQNGNYSSFDLLSVTHDLIILEYYTQAAYVGTFQFLFWEYNQPILKYQPTKKAYAYQKNISFLINRITQDFIQKNPRLVIVDTDSSTNYLGMKVDYIEQYTHDENFNSAWRAYHYLTKIGPYQIYIHRGNASNE